MNLGLLKSTFSSRVAMFVFVAFLGIGFFGASGGMEMGKNGKMSDCLFNTGASICNMNALEHISAWQSTFTSLPFKNISLFVVFLLLSVFELFFFSKFLNIVNLKSDSIHSQRFRENTFLIQNKLEEAFSNGILNPKLF